MFDLYKNLKSLVDSDVVEQVDNETTLCLDETRPAELSSYTATHVNWGNESIYYVSDIHLVHKILNKFKNGATNKQIEKYIRKIVKDMVYEITKETYSYRQKENIRELEALESMILFGGDISSSFDISKIFYTEFVKECKNYTKEHRCYIYAVLGNHEFWEFKNIDECYKAYENLFESLNIRFLNNRACWFPREKKLKKEGYTEENYKKALPYLYNMIIVGGTGFAGCNETFNANSGIYRDTITREEEINIGG